jgi:hypothetical protein
MGTADNIVAATLEHDPLEDIESGQPLLFRQEMPLLAIWENTAEQIRASGARRQGLHKRWGEDVGLRMIYLHRQFHGGGGLTPRAIGARISKLVQWQQRIGDDKHDGFAAELNMVHYSAPYEEVTPMALKLIKLELHIGDEIPVPEELNVKGDIDVSS